MDASEVEAAWAEVTARWDDEAAHRAFLDRYPDLPGLAEAGRRYRAALQARPGDAVAVRWREEIVKRATVIALSQLPRTKPPRQLAPGRRRLLLIAIAGVTASAIVWLYLRFASVTGAAP
ncbi:MAG TPA: hypothetical protein VEM76_11790 [Anaeromyxobacteraceae bacterium]|nr:hypothetical protein [Anaeromyxobacteraceae bacterium]